MRNLIFETLTTAAIAAGLPLKTDGEAPIYEAPVEMSDKLLPKPRIEIQLTKAQVKHLSRKLSKYPSPGKEDLYRTVRKAIDQIIQPVRLSIISNDENWLADFSHRLHRDLPRQLADRHNNNVLVSIEAVESTGGGSKLVDVAIKRKLIKVFHLRFSGYVTMDDETVWIKDVNIKAHQKEVEDGQEAD
ncbi:hypothetical protein [Maridesulfovibrio bastinii]|uniref:hypothetical protein n=1 Tax=Maridesulfovibrio bastinii TaxID=47157 RepID=UPI00040BB2D6|nr:hypothetical protein [Maridesulfovibrio bastinii]